MCSMSVVAAKLEGGWIHFLTLVRQKVLTFAGVFVLTVA
jgi:hypothetical protein